VGQIGELIDGHSVGLGGISIVSFDGFNIFVEDSLSVGRFDIRFVFSSESNLEFVEF